MKVALFSGKDSLYACMKSWPPDILLHLTYEFPRPSPHGMNLAALAQMAGALGLPLVVMKLDKGRERDQTVDFLMKMNAKTIIAGDVCVEEHLEYMERVAKESGTNLMEPLWGIRTDELLRMEIHEGMKPMIIGADRRINERWLGCMLDEMNLEPFIDEMNASGVDPLGENGEYHTIVLESRVHRYSLHFKVNEVLEFSGYRVIVLT